MQKPKGNDMEYISKYEYKKYVESTKEARLSWLKDARFGMFIHYGLFSILGTGEWSMANENYTVKEYEELAKSFSPKEGCCDEWCKTAKEMGAKYCVFTTRHHEGFSLWNSKINPYNSYAFAHRDLVKEFTDACRKYDLKIGLYTSLMDWHHPDSWKCANDPDARDRFVKYIEELNTELLTNYGKIDILWYDVSCPITSAEGWDSINRNYKLRQLQPHIIINNRSMLDEDYGTPEEHISSDNKSFFESCMTLTRLSWGYVDEHQAKDFMMTPKSIIRNLHLCTCKGGNLLLNVSPKADGSICETEKNIVIKVGEWLKVYGKCTYGKKYISASEYSANTLTGVSCEEDRKTFYLWNWVWPSDGTMRIGGYTKPPKRISYFESGKEIDFEFDGHRIILKNLPKEVPDKICGISVLKMEFDEIPECIFRSYYPQITGGHNFAEGLNSWD